MKTYYSDFVMHCMRFYLKYPSPTFNSLPERLNWSACKDIINKRSELDKSIILDIYSKEEPIRQAIERVSKEHDISLNYVWKTIKLFELDVAKKREIK